MPHSRSCSEYSFSTRASTWHITSPLVLGVAPQLVDAEPHHLQRVVEALARRRLVALLREQLERFAVIDASDGSSAPFVSSTMACAWSRQTRAAAAAAEPQGSTAAAIHELGELSDSSPWASTYAGCASEEVRRLGPVVVELLERRDHHDVVGPPHRRLVGAHGAQPLATARRARAPRPPARRAGPRALLRHRRRRHVRQLPRTAPAASAGRPAAAAAAAAASAVAAAVASARAAAAPNGMVAEAPAAAIAASASARAGALAAREVKGGGEGHRVVGAAIGGEAADDGGDERVSVGDAPLVAQRVGAAQLELGAPRRRVGRVGGGGGALGRGARSAASARSASSQTRSASAWSPISRMRTARSRRQGRRRAAPPRFRASSAALAYRHLAWPIWLVEASSPTRGR